MQQVSDDDKRDDPQATVSAPAESAVEAALRLIKSNDRFKQAPRTGEAFIIGGAKKT